SLDVSDLEKKYRDRLGPDRFPSGRFSNAELHLTLLLIEAGWGEGGGANDKLLSRVQHDLRDLGGPDRYAPGMRIGYTGDVAITVEETSAMIQDLAVSTAIVMFAVLAVIVAYYRWWRSVLLLMPPLLLATVYAFAAASLPPIGIRELNSNTA